MKTAPLFLGFAAAGTIAVAFAAGFGANSFLASAPATKQTPAVVASVRPVDGVQGVAPFEGANNAIEITLSNEPIAEVSKPDIKRQAAQRKTRDSIVQARQDDSGARNRRVAEQSRRTKVD